MSRTGLVIAFAFLCAVLIAQSECRNLALTGGISSIFNTPFRVVGKRSDSFGANEPTAMDSSLDAPVYQLY
ncbi:unnamed protein product [Cylicocyclus nassatus]|uniref:Uncharacterized protein n=1 Tax=Cylicocyclus nassatus TaxID=53992 RepID=A0AA36HBP6_CYLNA|nr:unnamed protein product [Cylicocyclus nassatus]